MQYRPYINWTKTDFHRHLKNLANEYGLGKSFKQLIDAALLDDRWDPLADYDGCTLVQDMYHPCLSCFIHDYLWNTGQGGKDADKVFLYLMLVEGLKPSKAKRRYIAVRLYWLVWAKWKNIYWRNLNPYTEEFKQILKIIK